MMILEKIKLKDFRNIEELELSPGKGINLFRGENAQGKSNLLESLVFISTGRSFRTAREADLIRWEKETALIEAQVSIQEESYRLRSVLTGKPSFKKTILINDSPVQKMSSFIGKIKNVVFSRKNLQIITGPPLQRREFIDMLLSVTEPDYLFNLQNYGKILKQKNSLLKQRVFSDSLKSVLDQQLIRYGAPLIGKRRRAVQELNPLMEDLYGRLFRQEGRFSLKYVPSFPLEKSKTEQECFAEALEKAGERERERNMSLTGPHRDELLFLYGGRELKSYGSQGQQRFASIIIKIAEGELIGAKTGTRPIVFMDDCFSEIDDIRQEALWNYLSEKGQVFLTANRLPSAVTARHCVYEIQKGNIVSEN